jgi:hypothetical protein
MAKRAREAPSPAALAALAAVYADHVGRGVVPLPDGASACFYCTTLLVEAAPRPLGALGRCACVCFRCAKGRFACACTPSQLAVPVLLRNRGARRFFFPRTRDRDMLAGVAERWRFDFGGLCKGMARAVLRRRGKPV